MTDNTQYYTMAYRPLKDVRKYVVNYMINDFVQPEVWDKMNRPSKNAVIDYMACLQFLSLIGALTEDQCVELLEKIPVPAPAEMQPERTIL